MHDASRSEEPQGLDSRLPGELRLMAQRAVGDGGPTVIARDAAQHQHFVRVPSTPSRVFSTLISH